MANTLKFGNGKWATGKDTVLAFNDENNNFKPLPFSFSRASSGTVINKDGLIETVGAGEPRIDFKDNTKGALLLEPQRSNVLPYSEDFSQWGLDGGTQSVTPNYAVSPDGTQNAYRLQLDKTGVSYSRMYLDAGTIGEKTSSIWIKSNNNSTQNVGLRYDGVGVNLEITSVWKRFELTATSITVSRFQVILFDSIAGNDESCDIQIYGAQLEQGSYATSYIPTSGSAVTRVGDSTSQTVPSGIYGTNEVTFVIDFEINGDTPSFSNIFNTNKNTVSSFGITREDSSGFLKPFLFDGGINVGDMTSTTAFLNGVRGKFAVGYKNGDSVLVVKGIVEDTNSATFSNFNVNEIHLNDLVTYFGYNTNLRIYDFKLYNTRLSNAELQALTS